jgi:hypothetical protein
MRTAPILLVVLGMLLASAARATPPAAATRLSPARFWEVVRVEGSRVPWLSGVPQDELALLSCRPQCAAIPWQLDERDATGKLALDRGPEPNFDDPPGVLDGNDEILFMASDTGERVAPDEMAAAFPDPAVSLAEIKVWDPRTARSGWAYLAQFRGLAPRSPVSYVHYDPRLDRITGARVALGFARGTPRFLALTHAGGNAGDNLLDRMKIRATARFLWGLIAVTRTEDDVQTLPVAWRAGPVRVIRRQRLWVRLGWGIRTPIFGSDTYFYRDFAELPVTLRLNFPPHLLFTDVSIRAALDFRNLKGWTLETQTEDGQLPIDGRMSADKLALARSSADWFALHGPEVTLVQTLTVSPSLRTVRQRLFYLEGGDVADPPESIRGELPGIGYTLTDWGQVSSGRHWFAANSYALPPKQNVAEFIETVRHPLRVQIRRPRRTGHNP